jgi:hypothetical protein
VSFAVRIDRDEVPSACLIFPSRQYGPSASSNRNATAKSAPNDVDVVLVMDDNFRLENCPVECRGIFDHATAQARYGASVFWIRPGMIFEETVEEFIGYWQVKRDGSKRGILDVT